MRTLITLLLAILAGCKTTAKTVDEKRMICEPKCAPNPWITYSEKRGCLCDKTREFK